MKANPKSMLSSMIIRSAGGVILLLIYYARSTWFIAMSKQKDFKSNSMVNWLPESIRDGRIGDFENVIDWGISRERYWGTPLPVCGSAGAGCRHCIGSIEELKSMSDDCPDDIEFPQALC